MNSKTIAVKTDGIVSCGVYILPLDLSDALHACAWMEAALDVTHSYRFLSSPIPGKRHAEQHHKVHALSEGLMISRIVIT